MSEVEYEVTVRKRIPNPKFKQNQAGFGPVEMPYKELRQLVVVCTPKEFEALRNLVLRQWDNEVGTNDD